MKDTCLVCFSHSHKMKFIPQGNWRTHHTFLRIFLLQKCRNWIWSSPICVWWQAWGKSSKRAFISLHAAASADTFKLAFAHPVWTSKSAVAVVRSASHSRLKLLVPFWLIFPVIMGRSYHCVIVFLCSAISFTSSYSCCYLLTYHKNVRQKNQNKTQTKKTKTPK